MLICSIDVIPDKNYEIIGMVKGGIVKSKHIGKDIWASLKTIVGGEIKGYTDMMNEARQVATERMIDEATKLGADAIVGVRYLSSTVMQAASEVVAYGTAIKFK